MNKQYFKPTLGKDNAWRLRVVSSEKGEYNQLIETTGFIKFETEGDANAAFAALESGEATATIGREIGTSGLYNATMAKVRVAETEVA